MEGLRAVVSVGLLAALLCGGVFRFLAFRNREPDTSYVRSLLDGSGFTDLGQRYLRWHYVALSIAFVLVLVLLAGATRSRM